MKSSKVATFLGIFTVFIWSTSVTITRSISENIGPFTTAYINYLVSGTIAFLIYWIRYRNFDHFKRLSKKHVGVCGTFFTLYIICLYSIVGFSSNYQQVVEGGILNYLWPVFMLLFSIPILGNRATLLIIPGVLLSVIGIFTVTSVNKGFLPDQFLNNFISNPVPYIAGILGAVLWGLYSNYSRKLNPEGNKSSIILFLFFSGITTLIISFFIEEKFNWTPGVFWEMSYSIVVTSVLGYYLWEYGISKGNFILIVLFSYFAPLFSTLAISIYFGHRVNPNVWIGLLIIIAGSIISRRGVKRVGKSKVESLKSKVEE